MESQTSNKELLFVPAQNPYFICKIPSRQICRYTNWLKQAPHLPDPRRTSEGRTRTKYGNCRKLHSLASKFATDGPPRRRGREIGGREGEVSFYSRLGGEKDSSLFEILGELHSFHLKVVK